MRCWAYKSSGWFGRGLKKQCAIYVFDLRFKCVRYMLQQQKLRWLTAKRVAGWERFGHEPDSDENLSP